jgi:hypothetical protein
MCPVLWTLVETAQKKDVVSKRKPHGLFGEARRLKICFVLRSTAYQEKPHGLVGEAMRQGNNAVKRIFSVHLTGMR